MAGSQLVQNALVLAHNFLLHKGVLPAISELQEVPFSSHGTPYAAFDLCMYHWSPY